MKNFSIETLLTKALFVVIWAWVLDWLCSKGMKGISWILVLMPFILTAFMFLFVKDIARKEGLTESKASGCVQSLFNNGCYGQ